MVVRYSARRTLSVRVDENEMNSRDMYNILDRRLLALLFEIREQRAQASCNLIQQAYKATRVIIRAKLESSDKYVPCNDVYCITRALENSVCLKSRYTRAAWRIHTSLSSDYIHQCAWRPL